MSQSNDHYYRELNRYVHQGSTYNYTHSPNLSDAENASIERAILTKYPDFSSNSSTETSEPLTWGYGFGGYGWIFRYRWLRKFYYAALFITLIQAIVYCWVFAQGFLNTLLVCGGQAIAITMVAAAVAILARVVEEIRSWRKPKRNR